MSEESLESRVTRTETTIDMMQRQHADVASRLYGIERTVWVGVGILAVVQILVGWFIKGH